MRCCDWSITLEVTRLASDVRLRLCKSWMRFSQMWRSAITLPPGSWRGGLALQINVDQELTLLEASRRLSQDGPNERRVDEASHGTMRSNHYLSGPLTFETVISQSAAALDAARGSLLAAATGVTGADTPQGCHSSAVISCSDAAAEVKEDLAVRRRAIESLLKRRIVQATRSGEIPAASDAGALAAYTMTVIQPMSALARDGAKRKKVLRLARTAMLAGPVPEKKRAPRKRSRDLREARGTSVRVHTTFRKRGCTCCRVAEMFLATRSTLRRIGSAVASLPARE